MQVRAGSFFDVRKFLRVFAAVALLFLVTSAAYPQANQGTIQGSVFDQSGGAISGATVTIIDVARGVSRPITTDSAGVYLASNLIPGTYTVRAAANGFQTLEHSNVIVEVGQTIRVDLVLQPGQQTQTVTVTSEAATINTTDATLGGTISNQAISDLPMNGRDFKSLLTLRPGVSAIQGDAGVDSWAANGTRAEDVGYLVDGLRMDEAYTGNSAINSPITDGQSGTIFPVDALQEVNTEENPKAEFGWRPGVIINMGLKSGSNELHGIAFAIGRDTALNARNYFNFAEPNGANLAQSKTPLAFEQFGGSVGGRIIKDKLFWFVDYEGQQYNVGATSPLTTPVTTVLLGGNTTANVANSLTNACLALGSSKISPLSAQIVGLNPTTCAVAPQSYTPGPTEAFFPANGGPTTNVFLNLENTASTHNGIGKIDYRINDHNTINGEYYNGWGVGNFAGTGTVGLPGTATSPFNSEFGPITVQLYMGAWNWVPSSTRVNEFRIGYDRFNQPYYGQDLNVNPLAYGINTGVTDSRIFGFPTMTISGFTAGFGGGQHKIVGPDGSLQLLDHYTIVHGNHTFKFGGEFIDNKATSYQNSTGKGSFTFSSLSTFLAGTVNTASIFAGDPTRHLTNYEYALFGQDDWRASRRVTVNLGLRWEYSSVLKDSNNLLGNFSPTLGLQQVGKQISSPYNGDFKDFEPRIGVAWDIRGNGRTVLRAGSSLLYELLPMQTFVADGQVLGLSQVPTGATVYTAATPTGTPGSGNINILNVTVPGSVVTTNWQKQTAACVSGGTTACGTIFPASVFNIDCGDGGTYTVGGVSQTVSPCSTMAMDPNFRNGYIVYWTFGLQQALTNNLSLDASYVGTHGGQLPGFADINQPPLGSGFTNAQLTCTFSASNTACGDPSTASTTLEQKARPFFSKFPYLSYIDELENLDRSNYDALQVTLTQRAWHRWTILAGYTYSHALDNVSSTTFIQTPVDSNQPQLNYGNSDFDIKHRFTFSTTYALPDKKSPGQLLQGWQVNSVVTFQTPMPWTADDQSATDDFGGNGEVSNLYKYGEYWNFSGDRNDFNNPQPTASYPCWKGLPSSTSKVHVNGSGTCSITSANAPTPCLNAATALGPAAVNALDSIGCFVIGNSVLIPPALGTDGNAGRGSFRGTHFRNWDLSVNKNWKFKERLNAQFRAEFFNILNHPNFFNLNSIGKAGDLFDYPSKPSFGCSCITPDQTGNLVVGAGGARSIQLGLRLTF